MDWLNKWLDGKRTYITAILFGIFNAGISLGWWAPDSEIVQLVNIILGTLGLGFLRAGVKKTAVK